MRTDSLLNCEMFSSHFCVTNRISCPDLSWVLLFSQKKHFSHLFFFTCHIWENIMHLRYSSHFCSVFNYSHYVFGSSTFKPCTCTMQPVHLLDVLVALCSLCRHSVSFGLLITAGCSSTSLCRRHSVKKANKHVSSVNCPFRSTSATSLTCPSATNLNTFLTV